MTTLPGNLTPLETVDLGIHFESLMFWAYDRLLRRTDFASLQARLTVLRKDEKDHRKTLKAHRRSLFGHAPPAATEDEAGRIFPTVNVRAVRDKDSLLAALQAVIEAEEFGAYFYERLKDRIPDREARIFFEVLASEGNFHCRILKELIALIRSTQFSAVA